LREQHPSPDACEKLHAQGTLEHLDLPCCRRLAQVEAGRRLCDAASVGNRDEGTYLAQVHHSIRFLHLIQKINALDGFHNRPQIAPRMARPLLPETT
jgi:hypothetical protein